ncbi:MAG: hypothetical protein QOD81_295 [Solirubrobacteraceae bacterium]|jgi:uncharacterized glyoxalase superfamily protein PhnB|nr:hypothetical protein [Solirubrobacteraceae bacterium]
MSDQTVFPTLRYADARAAIDFLERAFGFELRMAVDNPDGGVAHAELSHGAGLVMLGSEHGQTDEAYATVAPGPGSGATYVVVDDADAHYDQALAAGADIVIDPYDTDYDSREYTAHDPEGNVWTFGTYQPWQA